MQAQLAQLDEDADAHTLVKCTLNRMRRRLQQTVDLFFEDAGTSSTGGISSVSCVSATATKTFSTCLNDADASDIL